LAVEGQLVQLGIPELTQVNLQVVVTANADASVWYWDGTYRFGS
jgi:hypothetical protein